MVKVFHAIFKRKKCESKDPYFPHCVNIFFVQVCNVHAHPQATVVWMKNSVELTGDDATLGRVGHRHTLTIPSITDSDFGNYTCRAKNIHGESYKVLEVSGKISSNYVDLTNF